MFYIIIDNLYQGTPCKSNKMKKRLMDYIIHEALIRNIKLLPFCCHK